MKRARIKSSENVVLEDCEDKDPEREEVKLDVKYCGICGSDVHAYLGEHPFVSPPITPGHEAGAVVMDVGPDVEDLDVGQKVTFMPQDVDWDCYNCQIGRYNICENLRVYGCQVDGAMAETFNVPANLVVPLSDDFDLKDAAMIEPTSVAMHAVKMMDLDDIEDKNIVILGAGTIGMQIMQILKAYGAQHVMISDLLEKRLELAEELGADYTINPGEQEMTRELLEEKFGEKGVGIFFEAVGVEDTIRQAVDLVRKGGKIIVVGVFSGDAKVQMGLVQDREINLEGSLMYVEEDYHDSIELIEDGSVKASALIDRVYGLPEVKDAFDRAADPSSVSPKVLVDLEK